MASISLVLPVPILGRFDSSIGTFGAPTLATSTILLFSITMSTGPAGGPPVPSINVAPLIISRLNGPSPSPALRSGAPIVWATTNRGSIINVVSKKRFIKKVLKNDD